MTHFRLLAELERDIRNQSCIDQMKQLNLKGKLMVLANRTLLRYPFATFFLASLFIWIVACMTIVRADDFNDRFGKLPCPSAEPCKVVILSQSEERILMQPNGILDTAAQARALDLGQFAVYLKTKISAAPAGEPLKVPEKHDAPVDNPIK